VTRRKYGTLAASRIMTAFRGEAGIHDRTVRETTVGTVRSRRQNQRQLLAQDGSFGRGPAEGGFRPVPTFGGPLSGHTIQRPLSGKMPMTGFDPKQTLVVWFGPRRGWCCALPTGRCPPETTADAPGG
jgi:hypothetical protein